MAAHRVLAAGGKARGGGDGDPSATTSNAASGRNDPVPDGFGRRGAVCFVAAPRRCPASPRRGASHPAPRRPERGRCYFPDRLLGGQSRHGARRDLLEDALRAAGKGGKGSIDLLVEDAGFFRTHNVAYRDGLKYPILKRRSEAADTLSDIIRPHAPGAPSPKSGR